MNFKMMKPPVVQNSQRTYKRLINLHFALLIVSVAAVVLASVYPIPELEGRTYQFATPLDRAFKVFLMLIVGAATSSIIELFYSLFEGTVDKFLSYKGFVDPINTGLIIALLLPTVTPLYVLILAVLVGTYAGKLVYGGYGYYIFNPALVGVLFAQIAFGLQLEVFDTPLLLMKEALNGTTQILPGLWNLLIGNYEAVAIGSTSVILLTLLFIYLCVTRVVDLRIVFSLLLSVFVISFGIGVINFMTADSLTPAFMYVVINMITGLTMFAAVFVIAEPISSPTSRETKIVYGVVVATMMMLVRVLGDSAEGLVFAVLFGNMITPFLNRTVKRSNKQTLIKTVAYSAVFVVFIAVVIGFILQGNLIDAVGGVN